MSKLKIPQHTPIYPNIPTVNRIMNVEQKKGVLNKLLLILYINIILIATIFTYFFVLI